jgi:hypothetical protein
VLVNNGVVVGCPHFSLIGRVKAFFLVSSHWQILSISLGVFSEQLFDSRNTMQQVYISNYTFS